MSSRSYWKHAEESCGREIPADRLPRGFPRGNKAWLAQGPARDIYDNLRPTINHIITNHLKVERADRFINIYMVGRSEVLARPTIMVCCDGKEEGREVRNALRSSFKKPNVNDDEVVKEFTEAGFCFERIQRPLEAPRRAVPLAGDRNDWSSSQEMDPKPFEHSNQRVFSVSRQPTIGRQLLRSEPDGILHLWATGGIVLQQGEQTFQLTSEHGWDTDLENDDGMFNSSSDDECSIDGFSEDEEEDLHDAQALGQASATPESSVASSSMRSLQGSTETSWQGPAREEDQGVTDEPLTRTTPSPCVFDISRGQLPADSDIIQCPLHQDNSVRIGICSIQASSGSNPGLDYALVEIPRPSPSDLFNTVVFSDRDFHRQLTVRSVATNLRTERRVILVAQDGEARKGVLMPGTAMFKRKDLESFSNLQLVQLEGTVSKGDCGGAVLDSESGAFCGHLVRGCPGTGIAYIVPAWDTFRDLSARGFNMKMALVDTFRESSSSLTPPRKHLVEKFTRTLDDGPLLGLRESSALFSDMSPPICVTENKGCLVNGSEAADNLAVSSKQSLIDLFISSTEDQDPWSTLWGNDAQDNHKFRDLRDFCRGVTHRGVSQYTPQKRSIWLHRRGCDSQKSPSFTASVTPSELISELATERGITVNERQQAGTNEKRLIYVSNLDPWAANALAVTSCSSEKTVLRQFTQNHLSFRSGFNTNGNIQAGFVLEFHIPCFAWRRQDVQKHDSRIGPDNQPLRRPIDVSFLSVAKDGTTELDLLYECQTSLCVTGWNVVGGWTALCLADSYFDDDIDSSHLLYDDKDRQDGDDFDTLPVECSPGHQTPSWEPREYFNRILELRLGQVAAEWETIRHKLGIRVEDYIRREPNRTAHDLAFSGAWGSESTKLIDRLTETLSETIQKVDLFDDTQYQKAFGVSDKGEAVRRRNRCFQTISSSIADLKESERTLRRLRNLCSSADGQTRNSPLWNTASRTRPNRFSVAALTLAVLVLLSPLPLFWLLGVTDPLLPFKWYQITLVMVACAIFAVIIIATTVPTCNYFPRKLTNQIVTSFGTRASIQQNQLAGNLNTGDLSSDLHTAV